MKISIWGGNGFIGTNMCSFLAKKEQVTSVDIFTPKYTNEYVRYVKGDYFNEEQLEQEVESSDVIIHAVSMLTPANSSTNYFEAYSKEVSQMVRLCELVRKYNNRLVFISSGGTVYGEGYSVPISESSYTNPLNHYGNLKLCLEGIIKTFIKQDHIDATIARVANPYGTGQDYHKGVGFIDAVVRQGLSGDTIEIWGDGENIRDYIHISDVCGMIYSLCRKEELSDIYNISTGIGTSQNQIIDLVGRIIGPLDIKYVESRSVDVRYAVLDNKKITEIYGKPLIALNEGIKDYIKSMQ